jgi:hypothetical protein
MPRTTRHFTIILGAGASKAANVGRRTPPLDFEFISEAFELFNTVGRGRAGVADWRKLKGKLKSAGIKADSSLKRMRLEQLSTYLEARANMPSLQHAAGAPAHYEKALIALSHVICRTLEEMNGTKPCDLHKQLFNYVDPKCVLTFNYDLIADQTLMKMGRLAWHTKRYCGGSLKIATGNSSYFRPRPKRRLRRSIPLLKLHGSINWATHERGGGYSLFARWPLEGDLRYPRPPTKPLIVAPVASKIEIQLSLRQLWQEASKQLRMSPGWIIWGYSFPDLDTITKVLFRTALARNRRPKPLIIINPDGGVVGRIKDALGTKVKVQHFTSVERFLFDSEVLVFNNQNV